MGLQVVAGWMFIYWIYFRPLHLMSNIVNQLTNFKKVFSRSET